MVLKRICGEPISFLEAVVSKDGRRHRRVPFVGRVRLSWEDARGEPRFAQAKCVDVSESGLRIESPAAIPLGTRIQFSAERIKLSGTATVKHATRYGGKYVLGVELAQPVGEQTIAALGEPSAPRGPSPLV